MAGKRKEVGKEGSGEGRKGKGREGKRVGLESAGINATIN